MKDTTTAEGDLCSEQNCRRPSRVCVRRAKLHIFVLKNTRVGAATCRWPRRSRAPSPTPAGCSPVRGYGSGRERQRLPASLRQLADGALGSAKAGAVVGLQRGAGAGRGPAAATGTSGLCAGRAGSVVTSAKPSGLRDF